MSTSAAGVAELEARLSSYRVKLVQLDTLIAGSPAGSSFTSLRADVVSAVTSIEERLVRLRAAGSSITVPIKADLSIGISAVTGAGSGVVAVAGGLRGAFAVGTRVEVSTVGPTGAQIISPGVVKTLRTDGLIDIAFIGSCGPVGCTSITVPAAALKPLPQPVGAFLAGELRVGNSVLARYGDGNWYNAEVEAVLAAGTEARVKFQGYGNVEILPREYVQRPAAAEAIAIDSAAAAAAATTAVTASYSTNANLGGASIARSAFRVHGKDVSAAEPVEEDAEGASKDEMALVGFVVPDALKSLPSDTQDEKERKKRRIQALKQAFKQKKADDVANSAAFSWQSFRVGQHSGIKRSR